MPLTDVATIEESVEISAPPAKVWSLIQDPRVMSKYSPETWRSFLRGGGVVKQGSRFLNINRRGPLVWPTRSKIVTFVPEQEIAWRVADNYTIWRLRIEPTGGGCRLVQTREAPQGISDISVRLTNLAFGGVDSFSAELKGDMATTLSKIKADAEA